MSTKTGVAPSATVMFAAATKLMAGCTTCVPGPARPQIRQVQSRRAAGHGQACLTPIKDANSFSNASTSGPIESHLLCSTPPPPRALFRSVIQIA